MIQHSQDETLNQPSLKVRDTKEEVDFRSISHPSSQQNQGIHVLTCSNEGCTSSFNIFTELNDHAIVDECVFQSERLKKADLLKTEYGVCLKPVWCSSPYKRLYYDYKLFRIGKQHNAYQRLGHQIRKKKTTGSMKIKRLVW